MTLSKQTCQRIAEVVKLTTERYWARYGDNEYGLLFEPVLPHSRVVCAAPTTLPEFIELFKKLGEINGWKDYCSRCLRTDCKCDTTVIELWKKYLYSFVDLAATDWESAEEYLNSLLT